MQQLHNFLRCCLCVEMEEIALASAVITGFQSGSMPVTIPDIREHSRSSGDNAYRRKRNFHFLRQRENLEGTNLQCRQHASFALVSNKKENCSCIL